MTAVGIAIAATLGAAAVMWLVRRLSNWFNGGGRDTDGFVSFADAARPTPRERLALLFRRRGRG